MPDPIYYFLRPKCNPDLVLTHVNGAAQLTWRTPPTALDYNQLWYFGSGIKRNDGTWAAFTLNNRANNKMLVVSDHRLVFLDPNAPPQMWEVGGDGKFGTWNAIRPNRDQDLNLNVLGNGPYVVGSPVGVYRWEYDIGRYAHINELWTLSNVSETAYPSLTKYTKVIANDTYALGLSGNSVTPLIMFAADRLDRFRDINTAFAKVTWAIGYSLLSKVTNQYVAWGGWNQPLKLVSQMSMDCLWWSNYNTPDAAGGVIRLVRDENQNFNVYGNPANFAGAPVYTWTWCGGGLNENWEVFRAALPG